MASDDPDVVDVDNIEEMSLWADVEQLAKAAAKKRPADDPLAVYLRTAARIEEDNAIPRVDDLEDAIERVQQLPVAEQRDLLNGWAPDLNRASLDYVLRSCGAQIVNVLEINPYGKAENFICRNDTIADDGHAFRIQIPTGQTREAVSAFLRRAAALVEARWDELILLRYAFYDEAFKATDAYTAEGERYA